MKCDNCDSETVQAESYTVDICIKRNNESMYPRYKEQLIICNGCMNDYIMNPFIEKFQSENCIDLKVL